MPDAPSPPRPVCFVAMPFGKKAPPGKKKPAIDFDRIYVSIERAVTGAGFECVRADVEPGGGFVHKPMYERLLVAECVVADLTFANPNVTYEVGVRHGASARATILIGSSGFVPQLPFDFRPLRFLTYDVGASGRISPKAGDDLERELGKRLQDVAAGRQPVDNPIMQVTSWNPGGHLQHDKTDVFLTRIEFTGAVGARLRAIQVLESASVAVDQLSTIERELLDGSLLVPELHTALLGVFLGYRERKAFQRMVDLYPRLPPELQRTAVAHEQLGLALNRLAEAADSGARDAIKAGDERRTQADRNRARELRARALQTLDELAPNLVTSETWGIRGRVYKGAYQAADAEGKKIDADAFLGRAIESYEAGVRADLRDYYPGVNAVTLRLARATAEDLEALKTLVPVVRFATECAPPARSDEERYWREATLLELASAAKDWSAARQHASAVRGMTVKPWMRETTANNLKVQQSAFQSEPATVKAIADLISAVFP